MRKFCPAAHSMLFGLTVVWLVSSEPVAYASDAPNGGGTNNVGEGLVLLKTGETSLVSYGLYCMTSLSRSTSNAPAGSNLVLILRNTGAKSINMEHVTVEDFSLQDAQGKNIKLYLWCYPRTMSYGDATVIHLVVDHAADAAKPWTLSFESKLHAHVPIELAITGIEPRKSLSP